MNDPKRISRSDLRVTAAWLRANRTGAFLLIALLVCAGAASVFGLLRWQAAEARWSFALLCWLASAIAAWIALKNGD